ncbi:MAG: hypothetical protein V7765_12570 [Oleispira sp.]
MNNIILIIKKFSALLAILLITGCSTMHFTQLTPELENVKTRTHSQWHDTTLNGMVEISYPVNLYENCQGQPWKKVTVEFGLKAGLTTLAVNTLMDVIIPGSSLVNMYAPWDVEAQCAYLDN